MTLEEFAHKFEGARRNGAGFMALCPVHEDRTPSFSISQGAGGNFLVHCHRGCETEAALRARGLTMEDLFVEKVQRRQRRDRHVLNPGCAVRPAAKKTTEAVTAFDWQACVAAVDEKQIQRLSKLRGYSIEFCQWLKDNNLLGIIDGHFAFPVHIHGKVVGAHVRLKEKWCYTPDGTKTSPLVIGELHVGDTIHTFESQWDAFAFMDLSGERSNIFITRGSGNGALTAEIPKGCTIYCWTQNDEAGEKWQEAVCKNAAIGCVVKRCKIPSQFKDVNDWTRGGATTKDLLGAITGADTVTAEPLICFKSPLELKNFVPPAGIILVGDCHITQGSVFVIGGAPSVGKSRASVALGVAGATGQDWFGLKVHRRFKVLIVQTENGLFRLSREFADLDCESLQEYLRICAPPPYGLCFGREDFRKQLAYAIAEFQPDIVMFDPWNAAAREQDSREYLDTFDALKSVLPRGDEAPALGIVAHTRKPKADEKHSGRALLNLLAGSYVLGSVPRTVFIMQAASDDITDNRVVWTCCKNNDGELGDRSAWERRNGLFAPVEFFDWDAFDHPPKEKRGLKPEMLREFLMRGREYDKSQIVSIITKETGRGKTVAYDLVDEAKRCGVLRYHRLTKIYEVV
jgi:AAA domain-containing protein